jgi:large subunit ribosomal protein L18
MENGQWKIVHSPLSTIHWIMAQTTKADIRRGVHSRIRKKVRGTAERPRLAVFRSLNHIYAQVIDDDNGKTLATASTIEKTLAGSTGGNIEAAKRVGTAVAERAKAAGVENVVFDRGGYVYHGRVKALLDATREAGLNKGEAAKPAKEVKADADAKPAKKAKGDGDAKPAKKAKAETKAKQKEKKDEE